jgi:hypothetical protein
MPGKSDTSLSERPLGLKSLPPLAPPMGSVVREFFRTCERQSAQLTALCMVSGHALSCTVMHCRAAAKLHEYLLEAQELDDRQCDLHSTQSAPSLHLIMAMMALKCSALSLFRAP